jgi:hypothetical protein
MRPPSPSTSLKAGDLLAAPKPAGERYYLIVFGSQSTPKLARRTHTWATMVRAGTMPGRAEPVLEISTISWMPASLVIRPASVSVEPGTNLDLGFTVEEMRRHDERISMWGPFEVWHGAYRRFVTQKAFLESGRVGYQCIDSVGEAARSGNGSNCIHAITDMDPEFGRLDYPLTKFGDAASEHIVKQILERPIVIDPPRTHDWLILALGLDKHPIVRRGYSGVVVPFSPEAILNQAAFGTGRPQ